MKKFLIQSFTALTVILLLASCKKYTSGSPYAVSRKIRFQLYTNQDFSSNTSVIHFSIFIKAAGTTMLDSAFAPMEIKDIPDALHKIVIEKMVIGDANSDLAAGFRYAIDNVGNSWYIDTCKSGNNYKVIDFNFQ